MLQLFLCFKTGLWKCAVPLMQMFVYMYVCKETNFFSIAHPEYLWCFPVFILFTGWVKVIRTWSRHLPPLLIYMPKNVWPMYLCFLSLRHGAWSLCVWSSHYNYTVSNTGVYHYKGVYKWRTIMISHYKYFIKYVVKNTQSHFIFFFSVIQYTLKI